MGSFPRGSWCPRRRPSRCHHRSSLSRAAKTSVLKRPAMMPTPASQVRQNYHPECEAAINSQAALEFHASFQCLAVAFYLDRDDVGLKDFYRFFQLRAHEHSRTAERLMFLQNERGGRICFHSIRKPETQPWQSGLQAMQDALHLEKCVSQSLFNLYEVATESNDTHLCQFLGTSYLEQQVKFIKELGDHVSTLSNLGAPEGAVAEYFFNKLTLGDGDKKD